MASVVVAFSNAEYAATIRNLLIRSGFAVKAACGSGRQALEAVRHLEDGILICGYRFPDMTYRELYEGLPASFDMLLVLSRHQSCGEIRDRVSVMQGPLQASDLLNELKLLFARHEKCHRGRRLTSAQRSEEERQLIDEVKGLLMEQQGMSEEEAHRYLQKISMGSRTNLVETAQMLAEQLKD